MNNIYDTHCHPHLNKIKNKKEVIKNFFLNGGRYLNIIGTNKKTINETIEIANKFDNVFVTIGIHPTDTYDLDLQETIEFLEETIKNNKNKIVGIGECGLDYYWLKKEEDIEKKKEIQKIFFMAQIKLAEKHNLPLIIHNRDSKDDVYNIIKAGGYKNFIFHCYSENLEYAEKLLDFAPDCKISFSGIVTFKNAKDIQKTAKNIPINNILAETDAPYLTPAPFRGKEENEPIYTKYVIDKISELKGKDCSEEIFKNSLEVFGVKK